MQNTLAVLVVLLGAVLVLFPVLVIAVLTGSTLHTDEFSHKGFGDNWTRRDTFAFFLLLLSAVTGAQVWLSVTFIAGSLLLTYSVATFANATLPTTVLGLGVALLVSVPLWWLYARWRGHQQQPRPALPPLTPATTPPRLHLNTPYTLGNVMITVHTVRKRQAFRPVPRHPSPQGAIEPLTWFVEFDCLLHNSTRKDALVWARLEDVVLHPDEAIKDGGRLAHRQV